MPLHLEAGSASSTFILALCLAAPHVLYGYIWFFPHIWRSRFKEQSVYVFDCSAWVLKGTLQHSYACISMFQTPLRASLPYIYLTLPEDWTRYGRMRSAAVIQFSAMILWIINEAPGRHFRLGAVEVGQWILGLLLVAAGQVRPWLQQPLKSNHTRGPINRCRERSGRTSPWLKYCALTSCNLWSKSHLTGADCCVPAKSFYFFDALRYIHSRRL